jgi:hypothetical protein
MIRVQLILAILYQISLHGPPFSTKVDSVIMNGYKTTRQRRIERCLVEISDGGAELNSEVFL